MKKFRKRDLISEFKNPKPHQLFVVTAVDNYDTNAFVRRAYQEGYSAEVWVSNPENWYHHGRATFVGELTRLFQFWKWDWSWFI